VTAAYDEPSTRAGLDDVCDDLAITIGGEHDGHLLSRGAVQGLYAFLSDLRDMHDEQTIDVHVVTEHEMPSVEVLFHLEDYDEQDRYRLDVDKWRSYADADRARITMQHGLQQRLFVRKGAVPAREVMIANARAVVDLATCEVEAATRSLDRAQEDLDALLAAPNDCVCRPSWCLSVDCAACQDGEWNECKALPARLGGVRS
jgi:hypothetical protein